MVNGVIDFIREPRAVRPKKTLGDLFRKKTPADDIMNFLAGPCFRLIVEKGISAEQVVQLYQENQIPIQVLRSDVTLCFNEREHDKTHTVWFRDSVEPADPVITQPVSVQLDGKNVCMGTVGLVERLLFGLAFLKASKGLHLDNNDLTLCRGTKYIDREGNEFYPAVYLSNDFKTCVSFYKIDAVKSFSCSRSVVYYS